MRRQDTWLELADRLGYERPAVVAVCVFLNLKRTTKWVARELEIDLDFVREVHAAAKPLLRSPRQTKTGGVCHYCGIEGRMTKDHVIPRSRGGTDEPSNIVKCCRNCNSAKGDRTPEEWLGCS